MSEFLNYFVRVRLVEQELLALLKHFEWGLHYGIFSFLCSVLSINVYFCPLSFGHYVVWPSIYVSDISFVSMILSSPEKR